jgi:large subunit ribosomal protein L4
METIIYNQSGKEAGKMKLPEKIFGLPWNNELVQQVVTSMMANKRNPIAHTKTRGEVSGTGKKPWKQKGTGRARHGSRRSPIWVGGGIAHGPRNDRSFATKINKKMRAKALFTVLSQKVKDGQVLFVDNINLTEPKTKLAKEVLGNFPMLNRRNNAAFVTFDTKNENSLKSFRNFNNLELGNIKDLNPVDVLNYKYLVITNPEKSFEILSARI